MSGRRALAALAAAVLVLACGLGGWAWETGTRPRVRGAWTGEDVGSERDPEIQELEDRVVKRLRPGASARSVESALDTLRDAGPRASTEPAALVARRAAWWRDRIAGVPARQRPLAIERARELGFTSDELDLLPRTPERERELVRRIASPSSSPAEAQAWARTLARGPLTPEGAQAAIGWMPTLDPTRRLEVARALAGTPTPSVAETWRALLHDPAEDLAVRRLAAASLAAITGPEGGLELLLTVLLDGTQPEPLRSDLLGAVTYDLRRSPEVQRAMLRLVLDAAAPPHLREGASWRLDTEARLGPEDRRALLGLALDAAAPESLRRSVLSSFRWMPLGDDSTSALERAILESIAASPSQPESLRREASTALGRMSPRDGARRPQRPPSPAVVGQP